MIVLHISIWAQAEKKTRNDKWLLARREGTQISAQAHHQRYRINIRKREGHIFKIMGSSLIEFYMYGYSFDFIFSRSPSRERREAFQLLPRKRVSF